VERFQYGKPLNLKAYPKGGDPILINPKTGKKSYADIVTWIQQKCEARKCTSWLENATIDIAKLP
jgi:hypothetical protein